MPPDANPAWNEVFFFPLRLPPICDEIQLAILSGSHRSKVLGTATLHLSQISSAGAELEGEWGGPQHPDTPHPPPSPTEPPFSLPGGPPGFLPCFGPSFLPFYGPREDATRTPSTVSGWQGWGTAPVWGGGQHPWGEGQHPPPFILQDTGVAYRGRVLLELSTQMGTPDGQQRDTIAPEDVTRVQHLLPHRRFGLCGVFYSATMVPAGAKLLQFELSLGNYGDTGDVTCKPAASVTPHGCPLFDGELGGVGCQGLGVPWDAQCPLAPGNRYHYLPWYGDKPVVAVTSSWEDAGHRWDALNLLRAMCRRLVSTHG
ncbi:MYOF protein, partial [Halcyon senegalensis]|nr:MYOF protein [Halcyon senegalensis]